MVHQLSSFFLKLLQISDELGLVEVALIGEGIKTIEGGAGISERGKLPDILLEISPACIISCPIMPRIETIIREKVSIVHRPVKFFFLFCLVNCIHIFLYSTIHKVESSAARMTVNNSEVLIKVVIILLCKLECKISAYGEKYLICLESAHI